ncbi:MAG: RidA family protein [Candidatus Omnitrophota bacterium]|jgi:enamine deaminase RidA (YjgF/YER057c/UK114 family)
MDIDDRIQSLNLVLPPPPKPAGAYRPAVLCAGIAYLSGQLSRLVDGSVMTGRVGLDLTAERGAEAARSAALNALSVIRHDIGWARFDRILRITGYIQTAPGFTEIPRVLNGASELFLEVFGDAGIHARSAVGVQDLPMNSAVLLEVTLRIRE